MSLLQKDVLAEPDYPESDGQPMAETPVHMQVMWNVINMLIGWFASPMVYVWGNMFLYYVKGNTRKNVSPDVFVAKGVARDKPRRVYKTWEEGKGPDWALEVTSKKTRREDEVVKFHLYQDILKVPEYFLFDPFSEYLDPPLKGYRLVNGKYEEIAPVDGRLPSEVLGLHLEGTHGELRLHNPVNGEYLPTPRETVERLEQARQQVQAENERLRKELDEVRKQLPSKNGP
jgi:Uma2 family endonuclease